MTSEDVFSAVTSSVRELYLLLRSIQFSTKAHVSISEGGIHFMTEEARIMQGSVLIEKNFFPSFSFTPPPKPAAEDETLEEEDETYNFHINLSALLEVLQILGTNDGGSPQNGSSRDHSGISAMRARGGPSTALSSRLLGTSAICRINYAGEGHPLRIVLDENNISTTCSLTTYDSEFGDSVDIPLQRERLTLKIIMKASLLLGAIAELDTTEPTRLKLTVSTKDPNLVLSAVGAHASASVEFSRDKQLLETFTCGGPCSNSYKFSLIRAASRAMALASKVSIRADDNGVLSLQFMIEGDAPGKLSFVDFRYVALLHDEYDEEESDRDGDHGENGEENQGDEF